MISPARSFSAFPTWRHSPAPPSSARAGAEWPASQPSSAASSPSEGPHSSASSSPTAAACTFLATVLTTISSPPRNPNLTSAAADGDFLFQDPLDIDYSSYYDDGEYYGVEWSLRAPPDMCSTHLVRYAIIVDEADASFRVIAIEGWMWMSASSAVFSSRTRKWDMIDSLVLRNFPQCKTDGMTAGRFVYWRSNTKKSRYCSNEDNILVLDTEIMVWSVIKAPVPAGESYCIADMVEHGGLCIVSIEEQCVLLWVRNINDEWMLKKEVLLMMTRNFKVPDGLESVELSLLALLR